MGIYLSQPNHTRKVRSDEINRELAEDGRKPKDVKVLLLGCPGSGKTTIVKQMKIIHEDGFSDAELAAYCPAIYKNVLDSAHQLITYMKEIGLKCGKLSNKPFAEKILNYQPNSTNPVITFTPEIAEAIHQLWKDPTITKIMDEHWGEFYLMDSAPYFFSEVLRIGTPSYLPTETDMLHSRQKSMGVVEMHFCFHMKLPHSNLTYGRISMFEVSCLQTESLSDYNQVLLQEKSENRMLESLVLFESIINSHWFLRTAIILFLTKVDVFKDKLSKVPLEDYFPEYTGGSDVNKVAKYILLKFMLANQARLSVYPHLTQVTDTTNIRLVFAAVKETILHCTLKDTGVL